MTSVFSRNALATALTMCFCGAALAATLPADTQLHPKQELVRNNGSEPETLDPALASGVPANNIIRDTDQDGQPAPEPVGERADDELADGATQQHPRDGELRGSRGRAEVERDGRERRQVHVDRDRREGRERAEHEHPLEASASRCGRG